MTIWKKLLACQWTRWAKFLPNSCILRMWEKMTWKPARLAHGGSLRAIRIPAGTVLLFCHLVAYSINMILVSPRPASKWVAIIIIRQRMLSISCFSFLFLLIFSFFFPISFLETHKTWAELSIGEVTCTVGDKGDFKHSNQFSIDIYCPDVSAICKSEKPFECWWGFWSNTLDKCICSPGFIGPICFVEDSADEPNAVLASSSPTPSPTLYFVAQICLSGITLSIELFFLFYSRHPFFCMVFFHKVPILRITGNMITLGNGDLRRTIKFLDSRGIYRSILDFEHGL